MSPFKSTVSKSVGKLLQTFRDRDAVGSSALNSIFAGRPSLSITGNFSGISTGSTYKYLVWTSPGSFSATGYGVSANYLMVGGGGAGSGYASAVSYFGGTSGAPTTFNGLTAYGGGKGGQYPGNRGSAGGSSGGAGGNSSPGDARAGSSVTDSADIAAATVPQGNPGGSITGSPQIYAAGGGGGSGAAGNPGSNTAAGAGGIGVAAFSGDPQFPPSYGTSGPTPGRWFGAGGGGAGGAPENVAVGGTGGGGSGKIGSPYAISNAVPTSGGGGGSSLEPAAGAGGCGGGGGGGVIQGSITFSNATVVSYPIGVGTGGVSGYNPFGTNGAPGIFVLRVPIIASVSYTP